MRRARFSIVVALLAANAVACHLILGIGDDNFSFVAPEAGEAEAAEAGPAGHCTVGLEPPGAPSVPDGDERNRYIFAFTGIDISGKTDAGYIAGYDLDGTCSCDSRDTSLRAGKQSCVPAGDAGDVCDDDGGVDNALAKGFALFGGLATVSGIKWTDPADARCGRQTALMILSDYNAEADDPLVSIGLIPSDGIRTVQVGGERDPGDCPPRDPDGTPYPAKLDGTDVWTHKPGDVTARGAPTRPLNAFVRDFQIVFDGRASRVDQPAVPVALGGSVVSVGSPILSARMVPLDERGNELRVQQGKIIAADGTQAKPASFKLVDGLLTGRVSTVDVLSTLASLYASNDRSSFFCTHPLYPQAKAFICSGVDTLTTPNRDFLGDPCNALSMAVQFEAIPAQLGESFELPANPDGGCVGFKDDCTTP